MFKFCGVENKLKIRRFQIRCEDSLEYMSKVPDGHFDCVITDPPYFGFGFSEENYFSRFEPFLREMARCSVGTIAISQPNQRLSSLAKLLNSNSVLQVPNAFADGRGAPAYFLMANPVIKEPPKAENWVGLPGSEHPNHRDVNKMSLLVKMMSRPGDTVLDPFCGSAAIGLAAVLFGRNYLGIEVGSDRAEEARNRLSQVGAIGLEM